MEQESDAVKLGKLLHREVFRRDEKDTKIGPVAFDIIKKGNQIEIREIKKSKKMEDAHVYQTLYYLYFLHKLGIEAKAVLSFPKSKENVELELNSEDEERLEDILDEISKIVELSMPPKPEYRKRCRKCAYFELCFS
jgi:CRISPR-associated exonuclease Cas4